MGSVGYTCAGQRRAARLVILPAPLVRAAIHGLQASLPMPPPTDPFALIHVAVGIAHTAAPMAAIVRKLTGIQRAVGSVECARAVLAIAPPRALVRVAVSAMHAPTPFAAVGVPLTLVLARIGVGLPPLAISTVGHPFALVQVTTGKRVLATPISQAVQHLQSMGRGRPVRVVLHEAASVRGSTCA